MVLGLKLFIGVNKELADGRGTEFDRILFIEREIFWVFLIAEEYVVLWGGVFGQFFFFGGEIERVGVFVLFEGTV